MEKLVDDSALYPELSDEGKVEAQRIVDTFKAGLSRLCEETIGDFYCEVANYAETDAWDNVRSHLLEGLRGYKSSKYGPWNEIRKSIYRNHREEIINDLNQDLVKEIETLKAQIARLRESTMGRF